MPCENATELWISLLCTFAFLPNVNALPLKDTKKTHKHVSCLSKFWRFLKLTWSSFIVQVLQMALRLSCFKACWEVSVRQQGRIRGGFWLRLWLQLFREEKLFLFCNLPFPLSFFFFSLALILYLSCPLTLTYTPSTRFGSTRVAWWGHFCIAKV